tara:strand:+ start:2324 stop:2479 length:156 start_codon:yes stop_codon:yes gene_type:complete
MRYDRNNVVNVSDIKNIVRDIMNDYSRKEMERNVKLWWEGEKGYDDLFDEG